MDPTETRQIVSFGIVKEATSTGNKKYSDFS